MPRKPGRSAGGAVPVRSDSTTPMVGAGCDVGRGDGAGDSAVANGGVVGDGGGGGLPARTDAGTVTATFTPRKFDPRTFSNPDGIIRHFGYDILKRSHNGQQQSAVAYVRSKLRHDSGPLNAAPLHRDVTANLFLVPASCPDVLADAWSFWQLLDSDVISSIQQLLAGPTIWFPDVASQHGAVRSVRDFAEACIVDRYQVAAQLIAHAPHRICHKSDFHIHVLISARSIGRSGLQAFVQELFADGCQRQMKAQWDAWEATYTKPAR